MLGILLRIAPSRLRLTFTDKDLRGRRNSSLPVSRLPPEILQDIFIHGARDYYESDDYPPFNVPHWVNVSYVCRHWRQVALNCPTLWTYHFIISVRWSAELLVRSKQASLKIRLWFPLERGSAWCVRLTDMLLGHAERIQELRVRVPFILYPHYIYFLHAPRLQTLDIGGSWPLPFSSLAFESWQIPPLRTLKLHYWSLRWNSTLDLSALTVLFLCEFPSSSQQSVVDFLAVLRRMPCLAVLHLEDALADSRTFLLSGACDVVPKVNLPSLALLFHAAPLLTVVAFLSCITIPSNTELELKFKWEGSSVTDYARIPPALAQTFMHLSSSGLTIPSLFVSFPLQKEGTFKLYGNHTPRVLNCSTSDTHLPLMIDIVPDPSDEGSDQLHVLRDVPSSFPLTHVQFLHIVTPPSSHEFWKEILAQLHGLRHLKLSRGPMPDLVSLLATVGDETLSDRHAHVPSLEALELEHIEFASSKDAQSLVDALSTRIVPHPRLTMIDCSGGLDRGRGARLKLFRRLARRPARGQFVTDDLRIL